MSQITLYVPKMDELWFRKQLLEDPETMSYNKGYELASPHYHKENGCIDFPKESWAAWAKRFLNQEPMRFYAYILRVEDQTFLGEVNLHRNDEGDWYDMGIVLHAQYRGHGYAYTALQLLLEYAFDHLHAQAVHNDFESTRKAALRIHQAAGFTILHEDKGLLTLRIDKQHYRKNNTL